MPRKTRKSRREAQYVGPELPRQGARAGGKIEIVHGLVPDPNRTLDQRPGEVGSRMQRAAINARIDCLEIEFRAERISRAAYDAGRHIDAIFESAYGRHAVAAGFAERTSAALSPVSLQTRLMGDMRAAARADALRADLRRICGARVAGIVELVIGECRPFRYVAALDAARRTRSRSHLGTGKRPYERLAAIVRNEFRTGLETVAVEWERRGRP